jgi:glycosyltransferase involved in cell wall biosynthesis
LHILLVTARYPWPPRRGDQLRASQMLELLAPEHQVTLLAPEPPPPPPPPVSPGLTAAGPPAGAVPPPPLPPGTTIRTYRAPRGRTWAAAGLARAAMRGMPLQSGLFFAPDLGRQLRQLAPRADLVVLQLVRLAVHREDVGSTPLLVDLVDDLALNFARRAAVDRRWLRPALALEARLLARAQRWLAGEAAGLLVVCDRDREELLRRLSSPADSRAAATRVATVGLAVGAGPAPGPPPAPAAGPAAGGAEGPPRLVFTGNLGYFVNADAVEWWLDRVWPPLAARRPDLRLVVAGDRPRPRVRRAVARAAAAGGTVALLGSVPDLRPVLAGAAAALAPMRCGSGLPLKILEAWSQGVPVVASPWAAAGTSGVPGEDLLVADSPRQWVETLTDLLENPAARRQLAANGRQRLLADYSRQRIKQQLLAAVSRAVSPVSS